MVGVVYTELGKTDGRDGEASIGGKEFWVALVPADGEDMMLDCRLESDWLLLDCPKWLPRGELHIKRSNIFSHI